MAVSRRRGADVSKSKLLLFESKPGTFRSIDCPLYFVIPIPPRPASMRSVRYLRKVGLGFSAVSTASTIVQSGT